MTAPRPLRQIGRWADAYPEEAFEPISDEQLARASEALAKVGISLGALHARWGSHPRGGHREAGERGPCCGERARGRAH
jgi:hypothetical protein